MDRIDVIDREARRFAETLSSGDPAARVPTCPEWDARALLWHLTGVHRFWADVLAQDPQTEEEVGALEQEGIQPPGSIEEILPLRAAATADLLAQLRVLSDDEPRWTWWDTDQTVGFTRRMQTYEATMHRIDAELTAGTEVSAIEPDVAAGAIDQCLDVMWGWMADWSSIRGDRRRRAGRCRHGAAMARRDRALVRRRPGVRQHVRHGSGRPRGRWRSAHGHGDGCRRAAEPLGMGAAARSRAPSRSRVQTMPSPRSGG